MKKPTRVICPVCKEEYSYGYLKYDRTGDDNKHHCKREAPDKKAYERQIRPAERG